MLFFGGKNEKNKRLNSIERVKELNPRYHVISLPGRVLVELPRPSALRKSQMHFPFEIIIWDTKVF
jgi:hypothetical protein